MGLWQGAQAGARKHRQRFREQAAGPVRASGGDWCEGQRNDSGEFTTEGSQKVTLEEVGGAQWEVERKEDGEMSSGIQRSTQGVRSGAARSQPCPFPPSGTAPEQSRDSGEH